MWSYLSTTVSTVLELNLLKSEEKQWGKADKVLTSFIKISVSFH